MDRGYDIERSEAPRRAPGPGDREGPPAARLLALQRTAGNRAVAAMLQRAKTRAPAVAQPRPLDKKQDAEFQMRKMAAVAQKDLAAAYGRRPADTREQWEAFQAVYAQCRVKGARNWATLQAATLEYLEDPHAYRAARGRARREHARRFREHYASAVSATVNPDVVEVNARGFAEAAQGRSGALVGDNPPYQNAVDLRAGAIRAPHNYANVDEARQANVGLQNSEVIWHQYQQVVAQARAPTAPLRKMTRANIQNGTTMVTVFVAYADDVAAWHGNREWRPGTEEFEALLGTPNVAPAAFLLADHMDEVGGLTIARIKAVNEGGDENIEIEYKRLEQIFEPRPERAAAAEREDKSKGKGKWKGKGKGKDKSQRQQVFA